MVKRRRIPTSDRGARALDPASGFKIYNEDLVRQWDNEFVDYRFVDERNPQDFVRGIPDRQVVPNARPEPPDVYIVEQICLENGTPICFENGLPIFTENTRFLTGADL